MKGTLFIIGFGPGSHKHITNGQWKPYKKVTSLLDIKHMSNYSRVIN